LLQAEVMRNKTSRQKSLSSQGDAVDVVKRDPIATPTATSPRHLRSQLSQLHPSKGVSPSVSRAVSSRSPSKAGTRGQSTPDGAHHIGNSLKESLDSLIKTIAQTNVYSTPGMQGQRSISPPHNRHESGNEPSGATFAGTSPRNTPSRPNQLISRVGRLSDPVLNGSALKQDKVSPSHESAPVSRMTSEVAPRDVMSRTQAPSQSSQLSPPQITTPLAVSTHARSPETMKQARAPPAHVQGGSGQLPPQGNVRMGQYTPVGMGMSPQLVGSNLYNKPAMGMIPGRTTAPSGQYVPLSR